MYFLNKQVGCAGKEDQSKKVSYSERLDGMETRSYPLTCIQTPPGGRGEGNEAQAVGGCSRVESGSRASGWMKSRFFSGLEAPCKVLVSPLVLLCFIFPQAQQYSREVLSVCGLKTGFVIHGRVWKTSLGMLSRKVVILRQALAT